MMDVSCVGSGNPTTDKEPEMVNRTDGVRPNPSSTTKYKTRAYLGAPDYHKWKQTESVILNSVIIRNGHATLNQLTDDLKGKGLIKDYFRVALTNLTHKGNHHIPILLSVVESGERVYYINSALQELDPSIPRIRLPPVRCSV